MNNDPADSRAKKRAQLGLIRESQQERAENETNESSLRVIIVCKCFLCTESVWLWGLFDEKSC
jgi:hypothetical protein